MPAKKAFAESKITSKNQITVPSAVRKFLGAEREDRLIFERDGDRLYVCRASEPEIEDDPVFANFLSFIEQDIAANPQNLIPVTQDMKDEMDAFFDGVDLELDLDAPLENDD